VIARLCEPASELHIAEDWYRRTALDDLLGVPAERVNDDRLVAVIEMPNIHSLFLFEHEFDDFLCASIGEEENGMALSVMSAFARRNVDPWEEAARLSRLPRNVATESCARSSRSCRRARVAPVRDR